MPATLLLADDSVTIQRVIELTFAHEGVRVVSVSDGRQAIRWIDIERPDIVLVDVGLPQVDGYSVAAHVKKSPALQHIPVLLLTGAFEPIDEAKARASGCDGILIKPFEPKQLVSRVKDLLAGNRPAPTWPAEDVTRSQPGRPAPSAEPETMVVIVPVPVVDLEFESLDAGLDRLDPASAPMPAASIDLEVVPDFGDRAGLGLADAPIHDEPVSRFADIYGGVPAARPPVAAPAAPVAPPAAPVHHAPIHIPVSVPEPPVPAAPAAAAEPPAPSWPARMATIPEPVIDEPIAPEPAMPVVLTDTPMPEPPAVATFEGEGGPVWTSELTAAEMLVAEPLEPPSAPLWAQQSSMPTSMPDVVLAPPVHAAPVYQAAPQTQIAPIAPAQPAGTPLSLANAFSALLTAERAQPAALVPQVTEEQVEDVVRKVLTRLTGDMVRSVVTDAAERLVRQEIEKIKSDTDAE